MTEALHHIRLVAGIEVRPPSPSARFAFERDQSERLGPLVGDDLAECVPGVVEGHLVTGPALLEPGAVLHPDRAPWKALRSIAGLSDDAEPGLTCIGLHGGRPPAENLVPDRLPPDGLFLCLPLLLAAPADRAEALEGELERRLFEQGGLRPPSLGTLAEITGLEPVHGQLMTHADLMALAKVQLAGAGLDPFWPPVEHALLSPETPSAMELPGGLAAQWVPEQRTWRLSFVPFGAVETGADGYALWIRSFRQTTALLDTHRVPWTTTDAGGGCTVDADRRWAEHDLGEDAGPPRLLRIEHEQVGLVGYCRVADGRRRAWYPLDPDAISELERTLARRHGEPPAVSGDLEALRAG